MNLARKLKLLCLLLVVAGLTTIAQSPDATLTGFWTGSVEREGKVWQIEMNTSDKNGELKADVTFVDLDVPNVPFPVKRTEKGFRLERPQPSGKPIVFDGAIEGDSFKGVWSGFGVDGSFSMKRSTRPELTYREEEVVFSNGDVKLAGTLLIPRIPGKHPAVVITHGATPNERTTYRSWARRFAEAGIAALIYDKRGSGASTGNTRAASMENLADDAIAGVVMLSRRDDIDRRKIGVAGHSQGGWIAPLAATRSHDIAFVIASAAAGVTPAEQSIYHREGIMRAAGIPETEIDQASILRRKIYDMNRKILDGRPYKKERLEISKALADNKDSRWLEPAALPRELPADLPPRGALELLFFDPAKVWSSLKVPVLAIWGDKDIVVPVEKSRAIIERLQRKAGNRRKLTVEIVQGVDHGSLVQTNGTWDFPRTSQKYIQEIVAWAAQIRS